MLLGDDWMLLPLWMLDVCALFLFCLFASKAKCTQCRVRALRIVLLCCYCWKRMNETCEWTVNIEHVTWTMIWWWWDEHVHFVKWFQKQRKICFPIQNSCVFPSSHIRHFKHPNRSECKLLRAIAALTQLAFSASMQSRLEWILHFVCEQIGNTVLDMLDYIFGIQKEINVLCKFQIP